MEDVLRKIQVMLKERRIRQADVGECLGLTTSSVWAKLNGTRQIKLDELLQISEMLSTHPSLLFPGYVPVLEVGTLSVSEFFKILVHAELSKMLQQGGAELKLNIDTMEPTPAPHIAKIRQRRIDRQNKRKKETPTFQLAPDTED